MIESIGKMNLIRKFAALGTICLVFAGSAWQIAQAQQRTTSLFSSSCVRKGDSDNIKSSQQDISIGRQVFTEIFVFRNIYMGTTDLLLTCRIRPAGSQPKFKTLRLAFGINDNSNDTYTSTVKVYLDGNLAASRSLSVGEKSLIILDVSKVSSVAIEIIEGNRSGGYVSFVQALLEPISSSPGQRY